MWKMWLDLFVRKKFLICNVEIKELWYVVYIFKKYDFFWEKCEVIVILKLFFFLELMVRINIYICILKYVYVIWYLMIFLVRRYDFIK